MAAVIFAIAMLGQQPTIGVVVSPPSPRVGDIVTLDATKVIPSANRFAWQVFPKLPDGRQTILPLGGKANLASVAGTYTVIVAIAGDKELTLVEQVVTVSDVPPPGPGPAPTPNPTPGPGPAPAPPQPQPIPVPVPIPPQPTPPPAPVIPDGRFKLAAFTFTQCAILPQPAKLHAAPLAAEFRKLAAAIRAGQYSAWQVPIETLAAFNRATSEQNASWQPVSKAVQAELRRLAKAGQIATLADLADAYGEIAAGLEAVR